MEYSRMTNFVLHTLTPPMWHLLENVCRSEVALEVSDGRELKTMDSLVDRGLVRTELVGEMRFLVQPRTEDIRNYVLANIKLCREMLQWTEGRRKHAS